MANLGIVLGGMAQGREARLGRELQERSLGIQESQLQFQQQTEQRKLVEASLTELTEAAVNAQKAGATGVAQIMRQRVIETAQAAGMDPNARAQMFDAAIAGALSPEQEAANKASGELTQAQTVADAAGVPVTEVLAAKGWLPAAPEQFKTLSDAEKAALDLPPETVVQMSEKTGEIKIVQGERSVKLRSALDAETGQPVFVTEQQILDSPGKYMPQPTGMKLVSDGKGGFVLSTGGAGGGADDLTNSTQTSLQGEQINVGKMLSRIENIDAAYDPEFLEFGARAESVWLGLKEKAGFDLSPEEKKFQERYTVFATRTIDNINMRLNELSGAAVSPAEAERLRASLPDHQNDSPTEFMAKVRDLKKRLKLEAMKLSYARQRGLDALSIGVEDFELVVEQKGRQIEQQIRAENPTAPDREVRALVQSALIEEFSRDGPVGGGPAQRPFDEGALNLSPQEQRIVDYHRNSIATGNVGSGPNGEPMTVYATGIRIPQGKYKGKFVSVPGWVDGRVLSEREAYEHWKDEINAGRWPLYDSGEELNRRAMEIHQIMDAEEGAARTAR